TRSPSSAPGTGTAPGVTADGNRMTSQTLKPTAQASNEVLEQTSFLFGTNAQFIEAMYAQYLENPEAVDETWRAYFEELGQPELAPAQVGRGPEWKRDAKPSY